MLRKIYFLIPKKMRWKVYVILFLFLVTALELLSIGLILPFISLIIEPKSITIFGNIFDFENYINDFNREKVLLYGLIVFNIIIIFKNIVLFIMNYLTSRFYLSINVELISTLFKKIYVPRIFISCLFRFIFYVKKYYSRKHIFS